MSRLTPEQYQKKCAALQKAREARWGKKAEATPPMKATRGPGRPPTAIPVAELSDDYLVQCVAEAQRRAAAVVEEASQRAAKLLTALTPPPENRLAPATVAETIAAIGQLNGSAAHPQ